MVVQFDRILDSREQAGSSVVTTPDNQLIAVFRETGRQDAIDELMRWHLQQVRSMVDQMVHNDSEADDVTFDQSCVTR